MSILSVESLSKIYGVGENEVRAVDNVSFSIEKGEFVAIIGASGSGKSTLLHLLGGVDIPTNGRVFIDNVDIYSLAASDLAVFRRRHIGLIYQFYNLLPTLTVTENIMLPRLLDGKSEDTGKLNSILQTTGLENRRDHLPNQLSGGQQQRVSIGRALINDAAIILADEPTGNLDSRSGGEIMALLKYSNKAFSQTLILITHDEKVAAQADRIITIEDGRLV